MENVRADVDVQLDFTELETTFEDFDQNEQGPQTRSEILVEDRSETLTASGVPGAASNVAPENTNLADANTAEFGATAGADSGVRSSRTTRNYELDRSIRYVRNQPGSLTRLSIAVVINDQAFADSEAGGDEPRADLEEMRTEMTELVRAAVGFDANRGDSVTVITAPFRPEQEISLVTPWYEDPAILSLIKYGSGVLAFLIIALFVMRPVIQLYLPQKANEVEERAKALADGELSQEELEMISLGEGESLEEIKAKLKPKKSTISADMLDTANTYDDKVALIRLLVAEDSGRVANVLKKMIKPA
jgi:flagellar M-ring protein FliF